MEARARARRGAAARADAAAAASLLAAIRAVAFSFSSAGAAGGSHRAAVDRAAYADAAAALRAVRSMARARFDASKTDAFADGTMAKTTLACVRETLACMRRETSLDVPRGGGGVSRAHGTPSGFLALAVRAASASGRASRVPVKNVVGSTSSRDVDVDETTFKKTPVDALFAARAELFARIAAASSSADDSLVADDFLEASAAAADALADEMDLAARFATKKTRRKKKREARDSGGGEKKNVASPLEDVDREAAYAAAASLLETLGDGDGLRGVRNPSSSPSRNARHETKSEKREKPHGNRVSVLCACARGVRAYLRLAASTRDEKALSRFAAIAAASPDALRTLARVAAARADDAFASASTDAKDGAAEALAALAAFADAGFAFGFGCVFFDDADDADDAAAAADEHEHEHEHEHAVVSAERDLRDLPAEGDLGGEKVSSTRRSRRRSWTRGPWRRFRDAAADDGASPRRAARAADGLALSVAFASATRDARLRRRRDAGRATGRAGGDGGARPRARGTRSVRIVPSARNDARRL